MKHLKIFDTQTDYNNVKETLPLPNMCLLDDVYEIASEGDEDIVAVEYLSGVLGAYIKTGIIIDSTNWRNIKFEFTGSFVNTTNNKWRCHGVGYSNPTYYIGLSTDNYLSYGKGAAGDTKTSRQLTQAEYTSKHKYIIDYKNSILYFDNESFNMTLSTSPTINQEFYIFTWNANDYNGQNYCEGGKLYNFKIYNNDSLIMDLIPVRVGTVGYLFDTVSKKLFANAGTGNFTLGSDIVPVEYLQSDGSAYIDSGIEATGDLSIECKFNQINSTSSPVCGSIYNNGDGTYRRHHLYSSAYYYNNSVIMSLTGDNNFHICKVNVETGECYLDNVKKGTFTKSSFNCGANYGIFARISANMSLVSKSSYFSWFKIWDKGVLVRDFISVRVGTVGYMYDKVSRQLFANVGTGSFVVGPDNPKIKLTRSK